MNICYIKPRLLPNPLLLLLLFTILKFSSYSKTHQFSLALTRSLSISLCFFKFLSLNKFDVVRDCHCYFAFDRKKKMEQQQQQLLHFCDSKHPLVLDQDYRGGVPCCGCQESVYGPSYCCLRGGYWHWKDTIHHNPVRKYPLGCTIPCTQSILLFSLPNR